MELSRGVGEVWYAGGSSHGVDGLRLFACGADLPRVYLQRATAKAYKSKRHGSEPTAHSGNGEGLRAIYSNQSAQRSDQRCLKRLAREQRDSAKVLVEELVKLASALSR